MCIRDRGERPGLPGFYEMGGMQSPGLTAAPAAACAVAEQMLTALGLCPAKEESAPAFRWPTPFRELSTREQQSLIAQDPRFGRVICRCETVTEGEIVRALKSPLTPPTIGAVTVSYTHLDVYKRQPLMPSSAMSSPFFTTRSRCSTAVSAW